MKYFLKRSDFAEVIVKIVDHTLNTMISVLIQRILFKVRYFVLWILTYFMLIWAYFTPMLHGDVSAGARRSEQDSSLHCSVWQTHRARETVQSFTGSGNAQVTIVLARDAQAKLASPYCRTLSVHPSVHLSVCVSVRDSLSHAYVRSIARREPRRLPACQSVNQSIKFISRIWHHKCWIEIKTEK